MRVSVPAVHVPSEHFRTMTRLFPVHFFQNVFVHLCDAKICQTTFAKRAIAHCLEWSAAVSTAHVLRTVAATDADQAPGSPEILHLLAKFAPA